MSLVLSYGDEEYVTTSLVPLSTKRMAQDKDPRSARTQHTPGSRWAALLIVRLPLFDKRWPATPIRDLQNVQGTAELIARATVPTYLAPSTSARLAAAISTWQDTSHTRPLSAPCAIRERSPARHTVAAFDRLRSGRST